MSFCETKKYFPKTLIRKFIIFFIASVICATVAMSSPWKEIIHMRCKVLSQEILAFDGKDFRKFDQYPDFVSTGDIVNLTMLLRNDLSIGVSLHYSDTAPAVFDISIPFATVSSRGANGFAFKFDHIRGAITKGRITIDGFSLEGDGGPGGADINLLRDIDGNVWVGILRNWRFRENHNYTLALGCMYSDVFIENDVENIINEINKG